MNEATDRDLPEGTELLPPEEEAEARQAHHEQLVAVGNVEVALAGLRAAVVMTDRASHRELTDTEVVQIVLALKKFSRAALPLAEWMAEVSGHAAEAVAFGTPLGKLLAAEGVTADRVRVTTVDMRGCGPWHPSGHAPDCPNHPDNLAKGGSQGQQKAERPAGFQGPKTGVA